MSWGIAETASEIEKIKSESADYLNGLNSCGVIDWNTYNYAFDYDLKKLKTAWKKYPVMAEQIKGVEAAIGYAEAIPSVMPKRKTGKWEIIAYESHIGGFTHVKKCSVCGVEQIIRSRFCPNCGARMEGYK